VSPCSWIWIVGSALRMAAAFLTIVLSWLVNAVLPDANVMVPSVLSCFCTDATEGAGVELGLGFGEALPAALGDGLEDRLGVVAAGLLGGSLGAAPVAPSEGDGAEPGPAAAGDELGPVDGTAVKLTDGVGDAVIGVPPLPS